MIVDRFERVYPPPTRHIPILIAGTGPTKTLPLVARYADSWHAQFPSEPAELEPAVARLRECCEAIGRDPASIEWGLGIEPEMLHHDLIKHADAYVAMGFTQFTLGVNGPDFEVGQAARVARLARRRQRLDPTSMRAAPKGVTASTSRLRPNWTRASAKPWW